MPSGAKKRKAAKKKKGTHNNNNNHNHNNNNNNNPTNENDEHRSQDEKSSDGGSPVARNHDARTHPFDDDDGSQKGDTSTDHSPVAQNESIEQFVSKQELKDDDTSKIDEEMKAEDNEEIKEISIEYVEPAKEVNGKDETFNISNSDYVPTKDEEKSVEKDISYEPEIASYIDESKPTDAVTKFSESAKADDNMIVGPGSVVGQVNFAVPMSDEAVEVIESVSVDNSTICDESGSSLNGNSEKLLPTTNENIEILQPAEMKVKSLPILEVNVEASSNLVESAVISNESTPLTFSEGPSVGTRHGTEIIKDSETEPLIAPVPAQQVARKTSWLNCCGIFDVLTGSSR